MRACAVRMYNELNFIHGRWFIVVVSYPHISTFSVFNNSHHLPVFLFVCGPTYEYLRVLCIRVRLHTSIYGV